jgi:hypothetical protein
MPHDIFTNLSSLICVVLNMWIDRYLRFKVQWVNLTLNFKGGFLNEEMT